MVFDPAKVMPGSRNWSDAKVLRKRGAYYLAPDDAKAADIIKPLVPLTVKALP